jgi:hypothetical protein
MVMSVLDTGTLPWIVQALGPTKVPMSDPP